MKLKREWKKISHAIKKEKKKKRTKKTELGTQSNSFPIKSQPQKKKRKKTKGDTRKLPKALEDRILYDAHKAPQITILPQCTSSPDLPNAPALEKQMKYRNRDMPSSS
jgi:hypothetical protein